MAVVCPAERHIPTEFQEIYSIVKGSMSIGQRQHFEESCQLIERYIYGYAKVQAMHIRYFIIRACSRPEAYT